ncbi:hypothetical protein [Neobacillus mesonae]|uniref:hypothetical protein n=1 Tax=Neobacillus mesonae TaxID=1193713 RepID=UPI00257307ED|nr:hypothetical protein [Neobacillus mesonae]
MSFIQTFNYEQDIEPLVAQDKALEIDKIIPIPFKESSINQSIYIKPHLYETRSIYIKNGVSTKKYDT